MVRLSFTCTSASSTGVVSDSIYFILFSLPLPSSSHDQKLRSTQPQKRKGVVLQGWGSNSIHCVLNLYLDHKGCVTKLSNFAIMINGHPYLQQIEPYSLKNNEHLSPAGLKNQIGIKKRLPVVRKRKRSSSFSLSCSFENILVWEWMSAKNP